MKCYICDQTPPAAVIRYAVTDAIGICHDCGIGVCASHSHKDMDPGSQLLCIQCASLHGGISIVKPSDGSLIKGRTSPRLRLLPIRQPVLGAPALSRSA